MEDCCGELPVCISSCRGPADPANRSHPPYRRWLNRPVGPTGTESEAFEYAELLRRLEAAQESDAIEQALVAAREHLAIDGSYVTTIGTLCCVARERRTGLQADELRFMEVLAGIVATRIERARGDLARLTERFRRSAPPEPERPPA
jgi:hypothetical protein